MGKEVHVNVILIAFFIRILISEVDLIFGRIHDVQRRSRLFNFILTYYHPHKREVEREWPGERERVRKRRRRRDKLKDKKDRRNPTVIFPSWPKASEASGKTSH